jgi:thiamine-monophosphate kinase
MTSQMTGNRETPTMSGSELELLRRIRLRAGDARGGRGGLRLGIGDDCALLRVKPGEEIAITTDLSIDGRHFEILTHPPEAIGHRTIARGLSDLAAMGARPIAAFLSLGLPARLTVSRGKGRTWIERFYDGLLSVAEANETPLAGGDLAATPLAVADIVLVGTVAKGRALLRCGAGPGDSIYVTGALGGAAVGFRQLTAIARKQSGRQVRIPKRLEALLRPHLYPQPRIPQGLWLRSRGIATAGIDISDGLSTDVAHLCEESGVAAELEAAAIPIAPGATLEEALHGGEDYELLFTAGPGARVPRRLRGVSVSRIGRIMPRRTGSPMVALRTQDQVQALMPQGWEHFSR